MTAEAELLEKIRTSTLQMLRELLKEYEDNERYEECDYVLAEIIVRQEKRQTENINESF